MNIIIAPHPDDELIGCFEVINRDEECQIFYMEKVDESRYGHAQILADFRDNITKQTFLHGQDLPNVVSLSNTYYYPDPHFELHPAHRRIGMEGESLARDGFDVVFYTTNMNTPYIHEVKQLGLKQAWLDRVYSDQKDMWKYEYKYFLFEGYNKWIF